MQIDLTFRPRSWKASSQASVQQEERFGNDTLDLGAGKLTSQADGPLRCLDGGATDISSKGDGSIRCIDGGATDITSKGDGVVRCISGGATDIRSGLEMGYGCRNGDTSVTSGWKFSGL